MSYIRLRNRILQAFYRPPSRKKIFLFPAQTVSVFDELEEKIEKNITPLLAEFFRE
ncbi:MAG: hypothetical protein FWD19_00185 [Defluviitaleaceae bacterium]|nr:hypothetical protein [Defluviitaleaceae bacterium]